MINADIFAPGFKPQPFWWEDFAPTAEGSTAPPDTIDTVVVGSGFGGLSAALELARSDVGVVVLEAEKFGHGASTRNGGAISGGVNVGKGISGRVQAEQEMLTDGAESMTHLEAIIAREGIDCHYRRAGRFVGAWTPDHYDALAAKAERLNALTNCGAAMVPRARQREEIGSDYYHGGMTVAVAAQLHPALYYKGLLAAARRAGAKTSCGIRVERIRREGDGFTVETSQGPIRARHVVIATNGYTGTATPQLRRRLVPVASHIIATEELPAGLAREISPKGRSLSNTCRILCYYRLSPDGKRMIFGGRARFTPVDPTVSARILHRFMTDRFPQMRGVKLTHGWNGNVAFTFDGAPHMGVMDGLHYCMGCNGSGVAMLSYLGHQTARKIVGGSNRVCAFDRPDFPTRPFYTGNPWFLPVVGGWFRLRDRIDRWRA
ncbi:MAG: FAD-binding oxidoreductase [Alphaproteobacteria bacterium]|nr:FAD-binding oxidoreductase [Alphaproteobacteria bacterium]